MTTEPNTAQSIVDGQLAELQITDKEVVAVDYRQAHALKIQALWEEAEQLPDIVDKATLQANQDVLTKLTRARTGIDKWRKAWKEPWKKIAEQVDAYLGTNRDSGLQAKIAAIEDGIEAKKKAYLDEQAKAQREADRLLEERYTGRVAKLLDAGMVIEANGNLTIRDGEQTLSALASDIRFATDERMAGVLAKVETIRAAQIEREEAARQAKEAEERERVEEANRLAAQKAEQEAEAAKLKAEREAFEKERAEHAAKVKAEQDQKEWDAQILRAADRGEELRALGAEQYEDGSWHLGVIEGDPEATQADLREWTSDEWAPVLARFKEAAEARDNMGDRVLPIAGPGQHIKDGKVYFDAVCDESQPLQEGSAVVGAQPDHEQQAVAELLEEQHDIHAALNDLSIFANPENWTEDDYGDPVMRDFGKLFDMTNAKDGWIAPWEIIARALRVLAIEKA